MKPQNKGNKVAEKVKEKKLRKYEAKEKFKQEIEKIRVILFFFYLKIMTVFKIKANGQILLTSGVVEVVMSLCTIYCLYADDVR